MRYLGWATRAAIPVVRLRCLAVFLGGALFLSSGCAAPQPLLKRVQSEGPQWPDAPLKAKIEWVKSVSNPEDAGIDKKFWKKALEVFTGAELRNISKPYGVLFDDAGRLFVTDTGLGVVHLMDTKQGLYSRITAPEGGPFRSPIALAEDEQGGLYITDSTSGTVFRYDLVQRTVTPFLRELDRPTGMAYNRVNKLLYVAETGLGRIIAVDGFGAQKYSISATRGGEMFFNRPTDLAVDRKGQLFVNDPLNYKVMTFTPEGLLVSQFGEMGDSQGELDKPKGIAVDADGNIYVCDAMLDAVQLFDDNGHFLFSFGANGTGNGAFWMPSGIFIKGDYIFVSDTYNHRVQIFRFLRGAALDEDDGINRNNAGEVK